MLTHRRTWPLFAIAYAVAVTGLLLNWWGAWPLILAALAHLALLTMGSFVPGMGFYIVHHNKGAAGTLALTYDDGPHPEYTPRLLDLLREEGVRATFFCIGAAVEREPAIAARIMQEGHAIGMHTMHHRLNWGFKNEERAATEIRDCAMAIDRATGVRTDLFRPPFGVTSPNTARAMAKAGVRPVAWDLRTFDTASRNVPALIQRTLAKLDRCTIVVMHDTMPTAVEHTRAIIKAAKAKGRTFVTLATLLILSVVTPVCAQNDKKPIDETDPLVQALFAQGRTITTLQADFTQEKHLKALQAPLSSTGRFSFQRPARMRWQVDAPAPMVAVADRKDVRIMEGGKERPADMRDREVYGAITEMIDGIVSGRLMNGKGMRAAYFRTTAGLLVDLEPTDARVAKRMKGIHLLFDPKDLLLRELRMEQANGDNTVTRFTGARAGAPLPANTFQLP
ncbi:MAG TPA: polysaccharide deacetylase family protein [Flavobacteriales bacterium]|nr:polysaccharide deacetylase family protein [Flavobacteriales bacterium]